MADGVSVEVFSKLGKAAAELGLQLWSLVLPLEARRRLVRHSASRPTRRSCVTSTLRVTARAVKRPAKGNGRGAPLLLMNKPVGAFAPAEATADEKSAVPV